MWQVPTRVIITSGSGYGKTLITAFDNALLNAGIGNLNLIRVSSVLPPGAKVSNLTPSSHLEIALGSFVPAIYTFKISCKVGLSIASAIAVGLPSDQSKNGMIMEASIIGDRQSAKRQVEQMVKESFEIRHQDIEYIISETAAMSIVHGNGMGCVLCAAVMLP